MPNLSPLEKYRAKIEEKTGIYIGKDDPIVCLYAFLEIFLEDFSSKTKSFDAEQEVKNKLLMEEWQKSSKNFAETVLAAALSSSKQHAYEMFESASVTFKNDLNKIIQQEHNRIIEKQNYRLSRLMLVANIILFVLSVCSLVIDLFCN